MFAFALAGYGEMNVWSVKLPFAEYSVVKERLHAAPLNVSCHQRRERVLRLSFFGIHVATPKTLVENTGLEPVTSWLQTRRSPS